MVAGGDGVEIQAGGHAGEEGEAHATGRHLDGLAPAPSHAGAQGVKGEAVSGGEGFDEAGVVRRVGPEAVVDMEHDGVEAVRCLQVGHQREQGDGICPARDGESDASARRAVLAGNVHADMIRALACLRKG